MSEDNRETPGCSRVTCEGRAVCDGRITSDVLGGAPMLVAEQVRRLLQCLLHFVWWEWREDLLRKSSLQHHLQGLQFSVFPRRCGRKPRGTRSAVTAANGMMDGVFAANETGAPRGEGERLYPVFRDWSTALDSSAGEKNFLALCASDYYNGCLFHRNIKGFMVQTGDPTAQCAGSGLHGKQWAQHKCITVLHHIRQAAPFGPEVHSLWKGH
ncbi:uncharacterized protein LOC119160740 isoform X15 [Rhipicephalus microplus]|uniref:uncharacterized protein LOC119160740 isoform X15 n=1 Tax=Rhipicephalus microplus TaxID=6941 RepID=UPI003F6AB18E